MKKNILFCLFLLSLSSLKAQKLLLTENFDTIEDLEEVKGLHCQGSAAIIPSGCQADNPALLLLGNGASLELRLPESPYGIGSLRFDYRVQNVSVGRGFRMVYSYYSEEDKKWSEYSSQEIKSNSSICFPNPIQLDELNLSNLSRVKMSIQDYESGELLLDNIELEELSQTDFNRIQTSRILEVEKVKIEENILESIRKAEHQTYAKSARRLKDIYYSEVQTIGNVYNYVGHIDISLQIYDIFHERSEMANPLAYKEFDDWLGSMENLSDLAQKDYIKDLQAEFELQRQQYNADLLKGRSRAGKVLNFAADVGNILTGGKLKSVINSFKGVFSSLFSRANIEAKYKPFKEVVLENVRLDGLRGKHDVKVYQLDPLIQAKNDSLIQTGQKKYRHFSAFFSIVEAEYASLDHHSNSWKNVNLRMRALSQDAEELLAEYIALVDPELAQDADFIHKVLDNEKGAMKQLSRAVDQHFEQLLRFSTNKEEKEEQIKAISAKIQEVDALLERYRLASMLFKNLFEGLRQTLEGRNNPWEDWMKKAKSKEFEKAAAHWNDKRQNLVKGLLPKIIDEIDDVYVKPNLREVEPVWRQ